MGGAGREQGAILIISAAAPAISTYETDRAKRQLMQQYPGGDPPRSHSSSPLITLMNRDERMEADVRVHSAFPSLSATYKVDGYPTPDDGL